MIEGVATERRVVGQLDRRTTSDDINTWIPQEIRPQGVLSPAEMPGGVRNSMGTLKSLSQRPVAAHVIGLLALWACCWGVAYADHTACNQAAAALQILGSSGPLNAKGSASTSYLLWRMS